MNNYYAHAPDLVRYQNSTANICENLYRIPCKLGVRLWNLL